MPDSPTTTTAMPHSGPSAPVQGAAGGNAPAASSSSQPEQASIPLTPDAPYEFRDPDTGQIVRTTLGDATNALREYTKIKSQLGDSFDPEKFKLYQQLEKGDPAAVRSWLEKTLPANTPAAPDPNDPFEKRFSALEQKLNEAVGKLGQIEPIATGIREEMSLVQIGNSLKASAATFPLLSRFPNAPQAVKQAMKVLEQTVVQRGYDPAQLRQQYPDYDNQLLQRAMQQSEQQLQQMGQFFGAKPPAAGQPANRPAVVNDQTVARRAEQTGTEPAFVFDPQSGQFVPREALKQPVQNGHPIPPQPVQPAVGGVPSAQEPRTGPMTADEWRRDTRDRYQVMRNSV